MTVATRSFEALGTTAHVCVTDPAMLDQAVAAVEDELAAVDLACSRFRDDSELTALNRSDGRPFAASPLLVEALEVALHAAAITDGDVDPTIGRAMTRPRLGLRLLGARLPRGTRPLPCRSGCRLAHDRARRRRRHGAGRRRGRPRRDREGVRRRPLRASASLVAPGAGVLVNLGGDIAVAGDAPAGGWTVLVTDDHRSPLDGDGQTIALGSGGLATSSTTVRRWRAGGKEHHHIVDPRTGLAAAEVWRTVSVAAATCVDANTASTAAIVRGLEAPSWLERRGLPARLVALDGSVAYTGAWPEEQA